MEFQESLERVYRRILHDALPHVGPATIDRAKRQAFARIAHFALRSLSPNEILIADVLAAATASTDHPVVLRCLACGVWAVVDDDPRLLGWFTKLADRALERGHLAGFCVALELLVHLPEFEPQLPEAWLAGIRAARADRSAQKEVFWLGYYWEDRFHPKEDPPVPAWLLDLRGDPQVLAAAAVVDGERVALMCPLCNRAFSA